MKLITRLDDKRLKSHECGDDCCDEMLPMRSLRAALASLAEKEAALCRAREEMEHFAKSVNLDGSVSDMRLILRAIKDVLNELSSPTPCPHEARVKELEELVRQVRAIDDVVSQTDDGMIVIPFIPTWYNVRCELMCIDEQAELRRRAGGGK